MIDLLKNKKIDSKADENKIELEAQSQVDLAKKIESYRDLEGVTISRLNLGLWWVENRLKMQKIFKIVLIVISAIAWSIFIFAFGEYAIYGVRKDQQQAQEFLNSPTINHEAVMAMSAQDLRIEQVKKINLGNNRYDFLMKVTNPNKRFYADFDYYFVNSDQSFGKRHGFILPSESKYFYALGEEFKTAPSGVLAKVDNISWRKIDAKNFPDWDNFKKVRLQINITDTQFTPSRSTVLTEKLDLNELKFKVTNNTIYNYWSVNLKIILESRGEIVGINEYSVSNLMADEVREVVMTWPGQFSRIDNIIITPELDVTDSKIYIKYGVDGEAEE